MKTGIIVFAHGSSVEPANEAVRAVTRTVAQQGGYRLVETAFLESAQPDLPAAVGHMVELGADHIIVIPYFLTLGIHLRRDLPRIVDDLCKRYDGLTIDVTEPLDGHPALSQIVLDRLEGAGAVPN